MSFFKELRQDLSQAVNELITEEDGMQDSMAEAEKMPEIASNDAEMEGLLSGIDDFSIERETASVSEEDMDLKAAMDIIAREMQEIDEVVAEPEPEIIADPEPEIIAEPEPEIIAEPEPEIMAEPEPEIIAEAEPEIMVEPEPEIIIEPEPEIMAEPEPEIMAEPEIINETSEKEENMMSEFDNFENAEAVDENGSITAGMNIKGDILSLGNLEILGCVNGNIEIKGKLDISGTVNGNSKASEIYADGAKITGEIVSLGSVKVGQDSVIIGNITANSAVIAGAVKGDIDVHGPVILDTSAIVMGDIKSKSVQINNGAVIEGRCSQCYADVSPTSFFNDIK